MLDLAGIFPLAPKPLQVDFKFQGVFFSKSEFAGKNWVPAFAFNTPRHLR